MATDDAITRALDALDDLTPEEIRARLRLLEEDRATLLRLLRHAMRRERAREEATAERTSADGGAT